LRPKPRNHLGDFEAQITKPVVVGFEAQTGKPSTTLVLRLNQETDCWFRGQTGETVATSFEAKLEKTVATGFKAKPAKTVRVVLRPNHSQIINLVFEAQQRNPCS
jgi:hypothetical protein